MRVGRGSLFERREDDRRGEGRCDFGRRVAHQSVVEVSLKAADEALLFAVRERSLAPFVRAAEGRAGRTRGVEARDDVEVRRADEEGVRHNHEQHEPLRAARASLRIIVETGLQLLSAFPLVKEWRDEL